MIDETRIKGNLNKFSFPRLSGTDSESKAFDKLKQEFENLNLNFEAQSFAFSSFYSRIYPKIAFSSGTLIFLILFLNLSMFLSLIFILILLSILIASFIITRKPENIRLYPQFNSQNFIVKLKSKSDLNNNRIALFISHVDSKGQRFPIKIRTRSIKLWIISSMVLAIILLLKSSIWEIIFYSLGIFPLISNILASIMICLNTINNKSQGAVDNASGLACNLELLNYYSIPKNRLTNYDMWFLFTGAEESGTMGIRHFYNHLENFDPNKSLVLNFESIAKHVYLFSGRTEGPHIKNIKALLLNNAKNLKIEHFISDRVFGAHSDGTFLGDKGFQGYEFGGVESYDYMHTPNDTIDKINTKILEQVCLVLTDSLKKHDSTYFK